MTKAEQARLVAWRLKILRYSRTSRLNGKVERSPRVDDQEF